MQDPLMCTLGRSTPAVLEHFRCSKIVGSLCVPFQDTPSTRKLPVLGLEPRQAARKRTATGNPGHSPPEGHDAPQHTGESFPRFNFRTVWCRERNVFLRDGPAFRRTLLLPRQHLLMVVDLLGVLPVQERVRPVKGNVLFLSREGKPCHLIILLTPLCSGASATRQGAKGPRRVANTQNAGHACRAADGRRPATLADTHSFFAGIERDRAIQLRINWK